MVRSPYPSCVCMNSVRKWTVIAPTCSIQTVFLYLLGKCLSYRYSSCYPLVANFYWSVHSYPIFTNNQPYAVIRSCDKFCLSFFIRTFQSDVCQFFIFHPWNVVCLLPVRHRPVLQFHYNLIMIQKTYPFVVMVYWKILYFVSVQARDRLLVENRMLQARIELQNEQIGAMRAHIGLIRQHTITFILDQMDTLHMQRDTEVWSWPCPLKSDLVQDRQSRTSDFGWQVPQEQSVPTLPPTDSQSRPSLSLLSFQTICRFWMVVVDASRGSPAAWLLLLHSVTTWPSSVSFDALSDRVALDIAARICLLRDCS